MHRHQIASITLGLVAGLAAGATTPGCGQHHLPGVTIRRTVESSGHSRSYGVHVPYSYAGHEDSTFPVILGFHGSSSVGFFFEADTRLSWTVFTPDAITVFPDGLGGAWAGANYSEASVGEDLAFVDDLLDDLRSAYCVDEARVYATGMSIGGGFVDTLACDGSGVGARFAAFAPASGAFYTDNDELWGQCEPGRGAPVPILEFHGGADEDVPYTGGQGSGGMLPDVSRWAGRWARRNGCEGPGEREVLFDGHVEHTSWACGGARGVVQHYRTDDQKHAWPSTEPNFSQIAAGDKPTYLEANDIIYSFFMNHTLRG